MNSLKELCVKKIYDNDAEFFAHKNEFETVEFIRISKIKNVKGRVQDGDKNLNKFGKIDNARLKNFDPETKTLTIRVDDTNVPGFWVEIPLNLDQVEEWLGMMVEEEKVEECNNDINYCEDYMNLAWF